MKSRIGLILLVALMSSCAVRITPDGGKEVSIDGVQAFNLAKTLYAEKNAKKVTP